MLLVLHQAGLLLVDENSLGRIGLVARRLLRSGLASTDNLVDSQDDRDEDHTNKAGCDTGSDTNKDRKENVSKDHDENMGETMVTMTMMERSGMTELALGDGAGRSRHGGMVREVRRPAMRHTVHTTVHAVRMAVGSRAGLFRVSVARATGSPQSGDLVGNERPPLAEQSGAVGTDLGNGLHSLNIGDGKAVAVLDQSDLDAGNTVDESAAHLDNLEIDADKLELLVLLLPGDGVDVEPVTQPLDLHVSLVVDIAGFGDLGSDEGIGEGIGVRVEFEAVSEEAIAVGGRVDREGHLEMVRHVIGGNAVLDIDGASGAGDIDGLLVGPGRGIEGEEIGDGPISVGDGDDDEGLGCRGG